MAVYWTVAF